MSSWVDATLLLLTIGFFAGIVWLVFYAKKAAFKAVEHTKENLKSRGLDITDKGVSVKTTRRFDREDYVDATQRGFIKAMGASSFGPSGNSDGSPSPRTPPPVQRKDSSGSNATSEGEKKKSIFRRKAPS